METKNFINVKLTEKELNKLVANLFVLQQKEKNVKEKIELNNIMTNLLVAKRYSNFVIEKENDYGIMD